MSDDSRTARIRSLAATGPEEAAALLAALVRDRFGLCARDTRVVSDRYSLNSVHGTFETDEGAYFFKFHQEEGEERMRGEYYRAGLLAAEGLPIDRPIHVASEPGEQILVYRKRSDPRFADLLHVAARSSASAPRRMRWTRSESGRSGSNAFERPRRSIRAFGRRHSGATLRRGLRSRSE